MDRSMNNVIQFPKEKIHGLPQSKEEVYARLSEVQTDYINQVVDMYGKNLLHAMSSDGFDLAKKDFVRDFAFTLESIRSCLYRSAGIEHALQVPVNECMDNIEFDLEEMFDVDLFPEND